MGKKNPKRRFRKYLKGSLNEQLSLGTLAGKTLSSAVSAGVLLEKAWLSSVKATWAVSEWTPSAEDGPILCGVAHSDYTSAEIEAWIENEAGSWSESDMVQQEIARRRIRRVGVFQTLVSGSSHAWTMNDGRPIHTKCGWQLRTGQGVRMWVYNMGTGAFETTDPNVFVEGHANLWPN